MRQRFLNQKLGKRYNRRVNLQKAKLSAIPSEARRPLLPAGGARASKKK